MELFSFINSLFSKEDYANVSNADKKAYSFRLLIYMSIFDIKSSATFARNKVNPIIVADFYNKLLSRKYTRIPNWVRTKPRPNMFKMEMATFTKDEINKFCNMFDITNDDFVYLKMFKTKELEQLMSKFKKDISKKE